MFARYGVKIVRYANDCVLMGKRIPEIVLAKLSEILNRLELTINEEKSELVKAEHASFDSLGFTIRYDKDLWGRAKRYWNIIPSEKSCKKIRSKINDYLKRTGHLPPEQVANGLNVRLKGWLNYFTMEGVSYPKVSKRMLRWYLKQQLYLYYRRKSQRKSKLYRRGAFEVLVNRYGLLDPSKY